MAPPETPSADAPALDDTAVAFREESTPNLLLRLGVFLGMATPGLNTLSQRVVVANVGNALGRGMVSLSARYFMGGEDLADCRDDLERLGRYGARGILDYMVEGEDSPEGRDQIADNIQRAIQAAPDAGVPFVACKPSGLMDLPVLGKVQAGAELSPDERAEYDAGIARVERLAAAAAEARVRLFVDAEWVYMQDAADRIVEDLMRRYNRDFPVVYHTLQMYRRDRGAYLERLLEESRREGWTLALKLVRGAYMEYERQNNAVDPIHATIEDTHAAFDAGVAACLRHERPVALVVATHNKRSTRRAIQVAREAGIEPGELGMETAQLLGMSDVITFNVAKLGYGAYKYIPYGPLEEAVPYLVRRAEENSAIAGESTRELRTVWSEVRRRLFG